jgi:hypothetical protein
MSPFPISNRQTGCWSSVLVWIWWQREKPLTLLDLEPSPVCSLSPYWLSYAGTLRLFLTFINKIQLRVSLKENCNSLVSHIHSSLLNSQPASPHITFSFNECEKENSVLIWCSNFTMENFCSQNIGISLLKYKYFVSCGNVNISVSSTDCK